MTPAEIIAAIQGLKAAGRALALMAQGVTGYSQEDKDNIMLAANERDNEHDRLVAEAKARRANRPVGDGPVGGG